jgi:thiol:disulfide interchange protein DsbG
MTMPLTHSCRCSLRSILVAALAVALVDPVAAKEAVLPPAIQALQNQGARIVGSLESISGLKAYAAIVGGQPLPLYVTPDGRHVIAGMALDDAGKSADEAALDRATRVPLAADTWKELEGSHWISDGHADASRIVYVFTDPNCPYCSRFWADARPWVDSGKVQLRHIIIGILAPSSPAKAEALLSDKNPSSLFSAYEAARAQALGKTVASTRSNAKPDELLTIAETPSPLVGRWIEANDELMAKLGLNGTPGVVWRDTHGAIQRRAGVPDALLPEILGAR